MRLFFTSPFLLLAAHLLCCASIAEDFRFFTEPREIPERGPVPFFVLQVDSRRYSFLSPPGWQVQYEPESRKVLCTPPDLKASISFRLLFRENAETEQDWPDFRQYVLERFPNATITHEFPCYTRSLEGKCLDLEQLAAGDRKLSTRLASVPIPSGAVEFILASPQDYFAEFHFPFANLMSSFEVESPLPGGQK